MKSVPPVVNSEDLYRTYWVYLWLVGVKGKYPQRLVVYVLNSFFIIFWYPVHLILGLFNKRMVDLFRSLHFTSECFFCSFKFLCFRWKRDEIKAIQKLLTELDKRAESEEDRRFFYQNTTRVAVMLSRSYLVAGISAQITGTAAGLFSNERKLLHPAWFPYNVQATPTTFWISFSYQVVGSTLAIVHNLANDSYPPITFCVVAGHAKLLARRLSRIGHDENISKKEATKELVQNIEDLRKLMQIIRLMRSTFYLSQLGQFISSGINISVTLINILFFAENHFAIIYYVVFFAAMLIELFPSCYYGTLMSKEFDQIPYAIFSSNWLGMNKGYCRSLIILMQFTVVQVEIKAGGMVVIGMNAFFATVRMAYSFFTLCLSLK
ncbi:hypothetical protein KR026_000162 [Drosophila bipectinata]|nr:hypothetical protein KR026_000162 [Drosophila bipectinata]